MARFDNAFKITVGHEGKFSTDQDDNGNWTGGKKGAGIFKGTKYGISAKAYPTLDIKNLSLDNAKAIYKKDYWDKYGFDKINNEQLAFKAFDLAVNTGPGTSIKLLQDAVGITKTGVLDNYTTNLINKTESTSLYNRFLGKVEEYYKGRETFWKHGAGWLSRLYKDKPATTIGIGVGSIIVIAIAGYFIYQKYYSK